MKMSRYKADERLWVPITLVLFIFLWFVPSLSTHAATISGAHMPTSLSWDLYNAAFQGKVTDSAANTVLLLLIVTALITGAVAFLAAWVLQFPIMIFRGIIRPDTTE